MKTNPFIEAVKQELGKHLEVTAEFSSRTKHKQVVLTYRGKTRFLVLPSTSSHHRGVKNKITDLRRELRYLGAVA